MAAVQGMMYEDRPASGGKLVVVGEGLTWGRDANLFRRWLEAAGVEGHKQAGEDEGGDVVVCVGEEAFQGIMGMPLGKRRGSFYQREGRWVVGVPHPAEVYRVAGWQEIPVAIHILKRALHISRQGHTPREYEEIVVRADEGAERIAELHESLRWSFDLETIPDENGNGKVRCLGLAGTCRDSDTTVTTRAFCIVWPTRECFDALHELMGRNPLFVGHNLQYDFGWLASMGYTPPLPHVDTMQGFHLLHPELSKKLEFVTMWYQGHNLPYYKDDGAIHKKKNPTLDDLRRYYEYNIKDCVSCLWASEQISIELNRRGLIERYNNWHKRNQAVALEMQTRPMVVNREGASQLASDLADRESEAVKELHEEVGWAVNVRSPMQVKKALKERGLKLPVRKGKESTDEDALKQLYAKSKDNILRRILDVRKLAKANNDYVLPLVRRESISFGFIADATETFRFSSQSHPTGCGFNMQTVPKALRYLYPAPRGRVFIQPDLSQAEARYVAARSKCVRLMELFADPSRNVHMERAKFIFGREVVKDSPEYVLAKSSLHASNYREGPHRFSEQVGCTISEARRVLQASEKMYPEIQRWHEEVKHILNTTGTLRNCWGMERQCYEAAGAKIALGVVPDNVWKDAIAWEPQSSIPQCINRAIHELLHHREQGNLDIWFHQHGHDSFLASIPEHEATEATKGVILAALRQGMRVGGVPLQIPADLAIGYNWGWLYPWHGTCDREWWDTQVEKERGKGKADNVEYIVKDLLFVGGM